MSKITLKIKSQNFFKLIASIVLLYFLFLLDIDVCFSMPITWQFLSPGIEYTTFNASGGFLIPNAIYVFRIDLKQYTLNLAFANENNKKIATVKDLVENTKAILGINGGFFSSELEPLGLRIKGGTIKNPVKPISWWAVFYIAGDRAYIVPPQTYKRRQNIEFALQSGPRLLINGRIPSLKPGFDARSALGITREGKLIILATQGALSTQQVAEIMQKPESQGGLNCLNALNLDGGSSTQLYAKINNFVLDVPGLTSVTDAVLVVPKNRNSSVG